MSYTIFDWKGNVYLGSLSKKESQKYFNLFMKGSEERVDIFVSFLRCEGVKVWI